MMASQSVLVCVTWVRIVQLVASVCVTPNTSSIMFGHYLNTSVLGNLVKARLPDCVTECLLVAACRLVLDLVPPGWCSISCRHVGARSRAAMLVLDLVPPGWCSISCRQVGARSRAAMLVFLPSIFYRIFGGN